MKGVLMLASAILAGFSEEAWWIWRGRERVGMRMRGGMCLGVVEETPSFAPLEDLGKMLLAVASRPKKVLCWTRIEKKRVFEGD
jgi:hypothetical protein